LACETDRNSEVCMEPQPARTRSGLAYTVATPSGLRGRPEVGPDVSPGAEMEEAGAGTEVPPTFPNQFARTSMPENLPLDTQQTTAPPNTKPNERSLRYDRFRCEIEG